MKSIALKLWAGMMILVLIVIVLLWLFQIVFLENFYTEIRTADIKKEGLKILELLDKENKAEFRERLDAFAYTNNLTIEVVDLNGASIYSAGTTGHMHMIKQSSRIEVFQKGIAGQGTSVLFSHPRFGNKFMLMGIPVRISGDLAGVLMIDMPLAPVEDTASILKRQLYYITLILLTAALFISFFISRGFTRPILDIKGVSEKMAEGDFSARLTLKKGDEIGQLAETVNYLGEQLAKIEQLRKDLIANVSHELRTPLSLIRGYAETIRDVTGNVPEKRDKQIGIIIEESERLRRIVDDILNLSQLQAGYCKLNINYFPVNKILNHVINKYELLCHRTSIQILRQGFAEVVVEADEGRIEQVLYNLMNNAFNHTNSGGTITLRVRENMNTVRIEVTDTGSGIPEADIPHIWDRYYKAENTRGRGTVGTGLGLAIVKEVLEAHKTQYGVISQKGVGTTFWFELKKTTD